MRKLLLSLTLLLSIIAIIFAVTFSSPVPANAKHFKIIAYLPSWAGTVAELQMSKLTHVNYAFVLPNANGSLQALDNPSKLSQLVSTAHANGVKVLISVGGWNDGNDSAFETLAASATGRTNFTNSMINFVNQYGLDGVDIDWEYPDPGTSGSNYTLLMGQLADAMHSRGKLLTAAVVAEGSTGGGVQNAVFGYVDFLNIMSYDGGNPHASYDYSVSNLNYWQNRGLPASKTVLGVPFYARPAGYSYRQAVSANAANANIDCATVNGAYGCYNGIPTIQRKTDLMLQRGGGGIMFWESSQDSPGTYSLVSAIYSRSHSGTPPTNTPVPSGDGNPYNGTPAAIPGTVQIENFNTGGQGVAYNDAEATNQGGQYRTGDGVDIEASTDTGGGYNVGWTSAGEWLKYTVNVQTSGTYNLNFRVASAQAGGTFHLEVGGVNVTGTMTVPNTGGWQTWQTVTRTGVSLTAGQRVMRLVMDAAGGNFNWFSVTSGGTAPTNTPAPNPTRTNTPVPGGINQSVYYQIVNQNSNKCLDNKDGTTTNGTWVQQWACFTGSSNQSWRFTATDSGYYRISSRTAPALAIDVSGGTTATGDGAKVHLWTYGGATNQQWLAQDMGGGNYRFIARHSNKCLDVPSASIADGIQLQQYTCNNSAAQNFRLVQQP